MARILIVDDEKQILRLLENYLRQAGHICHKADSVQYAKDVLEKNHFELILCDICMPVESGIDLIRYVKIRYPTLGVVVVSVIDEPSEAKEILELGVYGYITKPFTKNIVMICVDNALQRLRLERKIIAHQHDLEIKVDEHTRELKSSNKKLLRREKELADKIHAVEDLNSALHVLLQKREDDRYAMAENVMANVNRLIKPSLDKFKKKVPADHRWQRELSLLESGLNELSAPYIKRLSVAELGLTHAEVRVAVLIKQGLSTKEIASQLNLSENTIMTHRSKIRTKLGLRHKRINLQSYLVNMQ